MKCLMSNTHEYREDDMGYIYYIDKLTGKLQNEDPDLVNFLNVINKTYADSKYTLYRCAQKLYLLKNLLKTENLPYSIVKAILEHHRMVESDSSPTVKPSQLISVIFDIFYAADKLKYLNEDPVNLQMRCSVLTNFFWNIFDPHRNLSISLLELKLSLVLLCYTPSFEEMVLEIFKLLADHNRCVSRLRFEAMLKITTKIFNYLCENNLDLNCISEIVRLSFENSPGIVGLNNYQFINLWKSTGKNYLGSYSNIIHTAFRIKDSESILHGNVKCISCQIQPIQGLRFKCQRCRNYSLCLNCFSSGFTTRNHNINHRMFEISSTKEKSNQIVSFISKLCNIFTFSSPTPHSNLNSEPNILIERTAIEDETELKSIVSNTLHDFDPISGSIIHKWNQTTCDKLNLIINQLTEENNKVANCLSYGNLTRQTMEDHLKCINEQIEQLKLLHNHPMAFILPQSSTPLRLPKRTEMKNPHQLSTLSKSVYGAEINRSYVEENRSDFSIRDISTWYVDKNSVNKCKKINRPDSHVEPQMNHFKLLLNKVKDIVDDSYSDNIELAKTTHDLEKVLDEIIRAAESKNYQ